MQNETTITVQSAAERKALAAIGRAYEDEHDALTKLTQDVNYLHTCHQDGNLAPHRAQGLAQAAAKVESATLVLNARIDAALLVSISDVVGGYYDALRRGDYVTIEIAE